MVHISPVLNKVPPQGAIAVTQVMLKPLFPPSCGVKGLNEENLAGRLLHGGEKHLLSRWEKKWSSLKYFFARKCQNIKEMRL